MVTTAPATPEGNGNYIYAYYSVDALCDATQLGGEYYILAARLENTNDPDAKQINLTSTCKWPSSFTPGVFAVTNP